MTQRSTGWLFVAGQAALLIALAFVPSADHFDVPGWLRTSADVVFWLGVGLAILAGLVLGRSLTATPVPTAAATLKSSGPYRWVRHPIYTGVVLIVVAMSVRSGSIVAVTIGLVTIAFFHWKASWEEARLRERFDGYAAYASRTPRFLPSIRSK